MRHVLALNAPNKASLHNTIPMFIVKQWGIRDGDKLEVDRSVAVRGKKEIVITITKSTERKRTWE